MFRWFRYGDRISEERATKECTSLILKVERVALSELFGLSKTDVHYEVVGTERCKGELHG